MIPGIPFVPPMRSEAGASFVLSAATSGTTASLTSQGVAVGDIIIAVNAGGGAPTIAGGGAGFTSLGNSIYWCAPVAGNLANGIAFGGRDVVYIVHRGAASAQVAVSAQTSGPALGTVTAGFVKNAKHYGLIGIIIGPSGATAAISLPATFATRQNVNLSTGGALHVLLSDRLNPVNTLYTNSATFTWSTTGGAGTYLLRILELLTA